MSVFVAYLLQSNIAVPISLIYLILFLTWTFAVRASDTSRVDMLIQEDRMNIVYLELI